MRTGFDMTFGAIVAIVMDYAAVGFIFGLLVLDRWLGVRRGITLDTLFLLIAALSVAAWFAGSGSISALVGVQEAATSKRFNPLLKAPLIFR